VLGCLKLAKGLVFQHASSSTTLPCSFSVLGIFESVAVDIAVDLATAAFALAFLELTNHFCPRFRPRSNALFALFVITSVGVLLTSDVVSSLSTSSSASSSTILL